MGYIFWHRIAKPRAKQWVYNSWHTLQGPGCELWRIDLLTNTFLLYVSLMHDLKIPSYGQSLKCNEFQRSHFSQAIACILVLFRLQLQATSLQQTTLMMEAINCPRCICPKGYYTFLAFMKTLEVKRYCRFSTLKVLLPS